MNLSTCLYCFLSTHRQASPSVTFWGHPQLQFGDLLPSPDLTISVSLHMFSIHIVGLFLLFLGRMGGMTSLQAGGTGGQEAA